MTLPDIADGIVVSRPDIGQRPAGKQVRYGMRRLGLAGLMMLFSNSMGFADAFTYVGMSPHCNDRIFTPNISDLQPLLTKGAPALLAE
ncbi:hypothetical protein GB928_004520 [Shinella curvata]|uniref:Uncharacterized protein n=1 Tax=Shinella curvata TaxID=1817964 RepID=A0ABT8XAZ2_9HYPH|nr:hypothetical protein [Shinella curvata]MCJ8055163.1 hypothetical protein [Shinella curvata]MDO6120441.1 hypothetical protein [Shinella curvata]